MIKFSNITKKSTLIKALSVLVIFSFTECKKGCTDPLATNYNPNAKKEDQSCEYENFDKKALLENLTNTYILPSLDAYKNSVESLDLAANTFSSSPNTTNLNILRNSWVNSLLNWQDVSMLDFGPAEYIVLKSQTNTYPSDTNLINQNITNGTWTFASATFNDQKGYQALDFLLNRPGHNDQQLVDYFLSTSNSTNYLTDIIQDLVVNMTYVHTEWNSSYKVNFINDFESNAQGSSVSNIVNALNLHYEYYLRRGKIGLPLGVFNGFSQQEMPELVECYYYGQSLPFAIRAVESLQNFINGSNYDFPEENNSGLDNYMDFIGAQHSGTNLSTVINNKLNEIVLNLNGLNDPLSNEVITNKTAVSNAYTKLQELVPLLKVDMTSALGVLITYQDNDGD